MRKHSRSTRATPPLGQHFLTRSETAGWVADAVMLSKNSTVLEIGPGHGILTRELLLRAGKVVAVEKDPTLVDELRTSFGQEIESGQLVLIEQDVRDFDPAQCGHLGAHYALVANIPYYITGYIIRKFLTAAQQPTELVLLIQKEVAERIVAQKGKESLLSLSVKAYGTPSLVRTVKAGAFSPPPKVDSAILAITNIMRDNFVNQEQEARFFTLLHHAFGSKRKTLGATLGKHLPDDIFTACGIPKTARPEDVRLESWLSLARS